MGDAAAAAASTSASDTPSSILICREDGSDLLADADDGDSADLVVARDERLLVVDQDEEYIALLLSEESASGGGGAPAEEMEDWMKAARSGCVRWIIKTTATFRFGGKTAYVAVTYLDRVLAQRRVNRGQEWALQLLAVACLSLAIKMEEPYAPRLSELGLEAPEFDSASILRMELFVLSTLEWRMIAVTPFSYISFFAARFREDERRAILLRAAECVFAAIKAMSSVEYQPSTVAVASILVARGRAETPTGNLDALKAILGPSCPQLDTGHVYSCYSAMIQEHDKSPTRSTSTGVASSGVSVAAHAGSRSPGTGASVSVGANNAAGTASPAAGTPDNHNHNKRRRLRSPQRQ